MSKGKSYEFLISRIDDVAPERYPGYSVRIICAAAMEEYSQSQLSEYKEKLKIKISNRFSVPTGSHEFVFDTALDEILTLIDKI